MQMILFTFKTRLQMNSICSHILNANEFHLQLYFECKCVCLILLLIITKTHQVRTQIICNKCFNANDFICIQKVVANDFVYVQFSIANDFVYLHFSIANVFVYSRKSHANVFHIPILTHTPQTIEAMGIDRWPKM